MSCRLSFQVHLTDDCTLRCRHCYSARGGNYLTLAQADFVLGEVLAYTDARALVPGAAIFCGGEPTLSPILFDSISACSGAGFRDVWLLTNGTCVTDEYARRLAAAGCTAVQICIEGDEATHNRVRNGSWNDVLRAWDCCRRAGLQVECQTTLHPENRRQVHAVVEACRGRTHHVTFQRHLPHDVRLGVLTSAEWADLLRDVYKTYYQGVRSDDPFVRVKDIHWVHSFMGGGYRCGLTTRNSKTVIVESNGDVYACRRAGIVIGNLFREPLPHILGGSEVLDGLERQAQSAGGAETANGGGRCAGCPGMAYAVHGDMCAEDPHRCPSNLDEDIARDVRERQRRRLPPSFPADAGPGRFAVALHVADGLRATSELPLTDAERARMLRAAEARGVSVSRAELQEAADAFRRVCGLHKASDTDAWFHSQRISRQQFHDYLTIALIQCAIDAGDGRQRPQ